MFEFETDGVLIRVGTGLRIDTAITVQRHSLERPRDDTKALRARHENQEQEHSPHTKPDQRPLPHIFHVENSRSAHFFLALVVCSADLLPVFGPYSFRA